MSIKLKDIGRVTRNIDLVRKKVKSILGYNAVNSDHYGSTILFNEYIDVKTEEIKIIEINTKYLRLVEDIKQLFNYYNLVYKDEYFSRDVMSGMLSFLGKNINVHKGIADMKPTIDKFAEVLNRVNRIAFKYESVDDWFRFSYNYFYHGYQYYLYGVKFSDDTCDWEIESIISNYQKLNFRIQNLLKICNYSRRYNIMPKGDNINYYMFCTCINKNMTDCDLIKIINRTQLFESNLKLALKELNIKKEYEIKYEKELWLYFNGCGHWLRLDYSFEEIKEKLVEIQK